MAMKSGRLETTSGRLDTALNELRREIVFGKYPVGTKLMPVKEICAKYKICLASAYAIQKKLEEEGFVEYIERKGCVIIPFDKDYWTNVLHNEIIGNLQVTLDVCKKAQLPKEKIVEAIYTTYIK